MDLELIAMHLFYGRTLERLPEGATFRNARFFAGAEANVERVTLDGDLPEIGGAYEAAGVPVERVGPIEAVEPVVAPAFTPAADPGSVEIPDDWRDLAWQPLRRLASNFSAVLNKAEATAAIEGELARRAAEAEPEANVASAEPQEAAVTDEPLTE